MAEETLINQVVRRVKSMNENQNNNDNITGSTITKYLPLIIAIAAATMGYAKLQASVEMLATNAEKQEKRMEKLEDKFDKYIENCERQFRSLANSEVKR